MKQDISSTKEHLQLFAAEGLRTLCCAVKELTESEYKNWNKLYHDASIALDDRQGKVSSYIFFYILIIIINIYFNKNNIIN